MKTIFSLLAGAVLSSVISLSAWAQPIPGRGRAAHNAPIYSLPRNSVLVTHHSAGPTTSELIIFRGASVPRKSGQAGGAPASPEQLRDVEARVKASRASMAAACDTMPAMDAATQTEFTAARKEVKKMEVALRKSLTAARIVSSIQLAADYQAYATAVARVAAVTRGAFAPREQRAGHSAH